MTIFIGVDPGKSSPAHCMDIGGTITFRETPFDLERDCNAVFFVEGQFAPHASGKLSLMTLAYHAGLVAGAYLIKGFQGYKLPPRTWRHQILTGSAKLPKPIFHNRAKKYGYLPKEIAILGGDEIDAYLICVAGQKMLAAGEKMEKIRWKK